MTHSIILSDEEKKLLFTLTRKLQKSAEEKISFTDFRYLKKHLTEAISSGKIRRNHFGLHPLLLDMQTADLVGSEIGLRREIIVSILLNRCVQLGIIPIQEISSKFGSNVAEILTCLTKINSLYAKSHTIESENFRNLLLSFAKDMRVILIMIADRLVLLRQLINTEQIDDRVQIANEASKLYAPLAHKLGFYKLKSELEDLVIRYIEPEVYAQLSQKLEETAASRKGYIENFIRPIEKLLHSYPHLKFRIKGRTKSINSIWQKMQKQKRPFEQIYDLFAIRVILVSEPLNEKAECWQAYSLITDMYSPNPNRLRDWLSMPKSNGYESLHITVMGPEGRWVEVQIRTERMDTIAEHGLAAHWRYKGIKSEKGLDNWLASIRDTLENTVNDEINDNKFKMELYKEDIFVFTPKGDLHRLPNGATILDFAFCIHSGIGSRCTGALVNGRNVPLRHMLNNGDQVEIITSNSQSPKQAWLKIATTSRARAKIRQALKEIAARQAAMAKEMIERKFKNHKIDYDERNMDLLIRKMGFKRLTDFYQSVAEGKIETSNILERYRTLISGESEMADSPQSAGDFILKSKVDPTNPSSGDVLIIERNLKNVEYKFAKCCAPIFGDDVFGFVTINDGISIHRINCPNAGQLIERYPYRVIDAKWSEHNNGNTLYPVTLRIVGHDDITIVNNVTSIISLEKEIILRGINIESNDSLFSGTITLLIDDISKLNKLIRKLETIKGVKHIHRT